MDLPVEHGNESAASMGIVNVLVEKPAVALRSRVVSLDALRGFDMFWIVGGYPIVLGLGKALHNPWFDKHILPQVNHAEWIGFTAWDLIMPLFLFMVGTAMPFSFARRIERGDSKGRIFRHVIYRVVVLWILGMVAQGRLLEYDLAQLRPFSNTLQAIAAGYLIASILMMTLRLRWQFVVTAALLVVYWGLMTLVPVPTYGAGSLTPEGNLAMYIDKLILGRFQDGTTYTWILSSLTFAATVMIGTFAGRLLRSDLGPARKVLFLLASGIACAGAGWAWWYIFPVIKHLWTSSMVLWAGGWSLILLAVFYLVIDVFRLRPVGFLFTVIGMNAIAAYMVTRVFDFRGLGDILVSGLGKWTGDWHDLLRAVVGMAILWLILAYLYRKRTFIKI